MVAKALLEETLWFCVVAWMFRFIVVVFFNDCNILLLKAYLGGFLFLFLQWFSRLLRPFLRVTVVDEVFCLVVRVFCMLLAFSVFLLSCFVWLLRHSTC